MSLAIGNTYSDKMIYFVTKIKYMTNLLEHVLQELSNEWLSNSNNVLLNYIYNVGHDLYIIN